MRESFIIDKICYDKERHMVYTKLGNGTETTYTYDKQRDRLSAGDEPYSGWSDCDGEQVSL